jgi:hypothetical protein
MSGKPGLGAEGGAVDAAGDEMSGKPGPGPKAGSGLGRRDSAKAAPAISSR